MPSHHVVPFLDFDFQCPERALVDRFRRRRQRLVGDHRRGQGSRVNGGPALCRTLCEVNGHIATADNDADFDLDRLISVQRVAGKQ